MKKAIIFCLIIGLILTGCSSTSKNSNNANNINVPGATSTEYIMGGKIATNDSINITSNISGKISEISTDIGQNVKPGDTVIKLDTDELQRKLNKAQSDLTNAQNLASDKNSPDATKSSENALQYQSQLINAQSDVDTLQSYIDDSTIKSPIEGTVSSRNVNPGDMVTAGQTLISIINTNNLYVNAYAPVRILNQIRVGQSVIIKVPDISNDELTGKIAVINSKVDSKSSDVLVKVTIDKKNSLLKPGMFAEIGLK